METGLERIRAKARVDRKERFTSLAHHVTEALILKSLKLIPRTTSAGVDGCLRDEAMETSSVWMKEFISSMHRKGYKPPPVRRVYIPKPDSKTARPIGVPCISDRACQRAVTAVLSAIYEEDFLPISCGGRPVTGAHHALGTLEKVLYSRRVSWVIEADIKNFFGSLDHDWVLRFIQHRIGDPRIISLIRRWLKAGVMEQERLVETTIGTPQGGPLSVLLSNVYLHYVLDIWFDKVVKPRMRGEVYMVRYIDDFVICCQYKTDADRLMQALPRRLGKFSLSLAPDKTRLIEFGRFARQNSERYKRPLKTIYFLGFTVYGSINHRGNYVVRFKTEKTRQRRAFRKVKELVYRIRHTKIAFQKVALDRLLGGLYRYYGISSNFAALHKIYLFTVKYWRKALSSRSQRGKLNWAKYKKILHTYPVLEPKIYLSYEELEKLAVL